MKTKENKEERASTNYTRARAQFNCAHLLFILHRSIFAVSQYGKIKKGKGLLVVVVVVENDAQTLYS